MPLDIIDPEQGAPPPPPVASSDEEQFDLTTEEGRRLKRKTRSQRIESPQYQEFTGLMLKDPRRYKWAAGFSSFYIFVHLVANVIIITCLARLSSLDVFIWSVSAVTPVTVLFFLGSILILCSGFSVMYLIKRANGLANARNKLYMCCMLNGLGTLMELSLMIPYFKTDKNSLAANQDKDDCIKHLDEDLHHYADWTYDQEEIVCAALSDSLWTVIKFTIAGTFCGQVVWMIILFEFACLVMHFNNPTPEVWRTYRAYRRHPTVELQLTSRQNHGRRSTVYSVASRYPSPTNLSPRNIRSKDSSTQPQRSPTGSDKSIPTIGYTRITTK